MKPLYYTASKAAITTLDFYPLEAHPKALWMQRKLDGKLVQEAAVPHAAFDRLRFEGEDIVGFYLTHHPKVSLPPNAIYWPVPNEVLSKAEGTEAYKPRSDLFDFIESAGKNCEAPNHTLIYKSTWDHQVYDIEGRRVLVPLQFSLWETRFDLSMVGRHLKNHPAVISFEIVNNKVPQNYEISGRYLGSLVVHPGALDIPAGVNPTRTWFQDNVINGFGGPQYDLLGIHQFRTRELTG